MGDLTAIILGTREEFIERGYASSYQNINSGECIYFSEIVQEKLEEHCSLLNSDCFLDADGWNGDGNDFWLEELLVEYNSKPPYGIRVEDLNKTIFGYHQWVYYNGNHYDSECPNGVANFFDLPFYKRSLEKINYKKAKSN